MFMFELLLQAIFIANGEGTRTWFIQALFNIYLKMRLPMPQNACFSLLTVKVSLDV